MGGKPAIRLGELAIEYTAFLRSAFGDRLVSVVLHGPVARGDATPDAGIDLLVIVAPLAPGPFKRKDLLAAADDAIAPLLAAAAMDGVPTRIARMAKWIDEARTMTPLYVDLVEDAVLLYDRDGFFAGILADVRAALAGVGARRVREGGTWYWDLGGRAAQPETPAKCATQEGTPCAQRAAEGERAGEWGPSGFARRGEETESPPLSSTPPGTYTRSR